MSFVQTLRRATAADHDAVDVQFGRYDLNDRDDYARFLRAHARALPAVEAALANGGDLPAWRPRSSLLTADLCALGETLPAPLPFTLAGGGEHWGALYVIEGSRLGGALLARNVAAVAPAAYLGAVHTRGEWRMLLDAIDSEAARQGEGWRAAAVGGARATFAHYAQAAGDH